MPRARDDWLACTAREVPNPQRDVSRLVSDIRDATSVRRPARLGRIEFAERQWQRRIARQIPAQYKTVSEKVLISPASKRWEVTRDAYGQTTGCWVHVPAQYGYQQRTVEVAPASVEYDVVPAVYGQRSRRVMVSASRVVHETVPAEYATRQRQVLVSPGSQYWAKSGY